MPYLWKEALQNFAEEAVPTLEIDSIKCYCKKKLNDVGHDYVIIGLFFSLLSELENDKISINMCFHSLATGSVPGPIVFGLLIDGACLLWDSPCSGTGNCWLYDNELSARGFLILSTSAQALGAVFLILSLVSYRAPEDETVDEADSNTNAFASQDQLDTVA